MIRAGLAFPRGALLLTFVLAPVALAPFGCERPAAHHHAEHREDHAEPSPLPAAVEKGMPVSHRRMLQLLDRVQERTADRDPYLGDLRARHLRGQLGGIPARASARRWSLLFDLGEAELRLGNEEAAIEQLRAAHALSSELAGQVPDERLRRLVFRLGVAYMRVAETQNCCQHYTPDSCVLPIRGDGVHTVTEPAEKAIEYFTLALRDSPPESPMHIASRWLLNLAYMAIAGHPDRVPAPYRIPAEAFESEDPFPRFANVAARANVANVSLAGAAIGDDFDGDGAIDLVVSTWDPAGQVRFHKNDGDGTFSDRTEASGLQGIRGGLNGVQADYDNDGDLDFLLLRGAWLASAGRVPNSLLRNEGDGTFTDVTIEAGLTGSGSDRPTQTAAWADYDNDGDLDLYVGNESLPTMSAPSQLFRNEGSGTFTDVAADAGVTNDRYAKAVVWGDYDGDRWPDLYVSNFRGANRLYHNDGDGTFRDVAPDLGVTDPSWSFPAWFWDFDNDGALDIFVSAYGATVAHVAADYIGVELPTERAHLYRGDGRGGFEEVAVARGLIRRNAPMGSNFGDLDNDGYLDFYLGTGFPDYQELMPNVMYHNLAGKRFADVSFAGGFAHLQKGHAVVFADFDRDGDQDVFERMGGAFPGDAFADAFYNNPGFGNRWITIEAVGVTSNRSAIGARIRLDLVENGARRSVYKRVNSGGSFGANPLRQNIGVGAAERIERIEVYWPTSDTRQVFLDVESGGHLRIVEGEGEYEVRSTGRLALAPGK